MDPTQRTVYLTFDDGPIPESTPFLLETLEKYGVKATFFVVGENVEKYPELFEQIVGQGHQIGNHTHHHLGSFKHWTATYLIDTYEAQQTILRHLPTPQSTPQPPLFRPPHGWLRPSIYYWLSKRYHIVMWDVVTRDYSRLLTGDDVFNNVRRYARNGSIITFHDSLKSIDKLHTALPQSIEWLQKEGYEFKTF